MLLNQNKIIEAYNEIRTHLRKNSDLYQALALTVILALYILNFLDLTEIVSIFPRISKESIFMENFYN